MPRTSSLRFSALLLCARIVSAAILSISLTVLPGPQLAGAPLHVSYTATLSAGDTGNLSARLFPYFDGAQYGAEVGFFSAAGATARGEAWLALPWSASPPATLQLAAQPPLGGGPTLGSPPPPGSTLSNAVALAVQPRTPVRPHQPGAGEALFSIAWEPWFTPLNFFWQSYAGGPAGAGLAEAIPSIGRYASVSLQSLRSGLGGLACAASACSCEDEGASLPKAWSQPMAWKANSMTRNFIRPMPNGPVFMTR